MKLLINSGSARPRGETAVGNFDPAEADEIFRQIDEVYCGGYAADLTAGVIHFPDVEKHNTDRLFRIGITGFPERKDET